MDGECAAWNQQIIFLVGLQYLPSLLFLCCISAALELLPRSPNSQARLRPTSSRASFGCRWAGCAESAGTRRSFTNSQLFHSNGNTCSTANCQAVRKHSPLPGSWWFLLKDKLHLLAPVELRVVLVSEALLFGECLQLLRSPALRALTHAFCHHNKSVFINKIKCTVFIH